MAPEMVVSAKVKIGRSKEDRSRINRDDFFMKLLYHRQLEIESRTLIRAGGFGPNTAFVGFHDTLHERETEAGILYFK